MAAEKEITVTLTKTEALALLKAAEHGLAVIEVLNLVPNTSTMERVVAKLRDRAT